MTGPWRSMASLVRPEWRGFSVGVVLQFATIASGIGLMATSAWLIATAGLHPSIAVAQRGHRGRPLLRSFSRRPALSRATRGPRRDALAAHAPACHGVRGAGSPGARPAAGAPQRRSARPARQRRRQPRQRLCAGARPDRGRRVRRRAGRCPAVESGAGARCRRPRRSSRCGPPRAGSRAAGRRAAWGPCGHAEGRSGGARHGRGTGSERPSRLQPGGGVPRRPGAAKRRTDGRAGGHRADLRRRLRVRGAGRRFRGRGGAHPGRSPGAVGSALRRSMRRRRADDPCGIRGRRSARGGLAPSPVDASRGDAAVCLARCGAGALAAFRHPAAAGRPELRGAQPLVPLPGRRH